LKSIQIAFVENTCFKWLKKKREQIKESNKSGNCFCRFLSLPAWFPTS